MIKGKTILEKYSINTFFLIYLPWISKKISIFQTDRRKLNKKAQLWFSLLVFQI